MPTAPLNFASSDERAGFRLQRFEVFNWGTFDRRVWRLEPQGHNSLLTGDIGTGKSTLVDALTTLLASPTLITYNQAAGADRRERDLRSYVRGYFKTVKDDVRLAARPEGLRGDNSYSVLLGYFLNEGYAQGVTLAQVFWTKGDKAQPERFYVVADRPLAIAGEFSRFGKEIADLKKKLRKEPGTLLFDSFAQYSQEFRRRMDIRGDQALRLFYQTVSMKTVGNLTDFVRAHMLEEPPVRERLEQIRQNFDNLNRAHEAVARAKDQIQRLEPLVADCDRCAEVESDMADLTRCRQGLHAFFAGRKAALLDERIRRLELESDKLKDRLAKDRETLGVLRQRQAEIRQSIADNGGGRLETLARDLEQLEKERSARETRDRDYGDFCERLEFDRAEDIEIFHANKARAEGAKNRTESEKKAAESQVVSLQVRREKRKEHAAHLGRELESLRSRTSNIPWEVLELRRRLCESLSLDETDLPFVGELLQVRSDNLSWEGALERLLRSFGLSLLVPDDLYGRVSRYVDLTHLGSRLVYFRVREEAGRTVAGRNDSRLVIHKLEIKSDSRFRDWLDKELLGRFDFICCDTLEEFQREAKALTRQGQTKNQGRRHEKDDRFRMDDRSRYVLGWSNEEKIRALEAKSLGLAEEEEKDLAALGVLERRLRDFQAMLDAARDLLRVREFQEIDWRSTVRRIADLADEKKRITEGSDVLRALQGQLAEIEKRIGETESDLSKKEVDHGALEERCRTAVEEREKSLATLAQLPEPERSALFPRLELMQVEALADQKLTVENCDSSQTEMRDWLQNRLDADSKKRERLLQSLVQQMQAYKAVYPLETRETDAGWEAAEEFRGMLRTLREQDLPRHEVRFKKLLNEGTINDIALFQNQLDKEQQDIRDKIALINKSLQGIEYNPGTYIRLECDRASDREVRDFQEQLKACLGDTLAGAAGEVYNEHKFLQVKAMIDRFNGREGTAELDQKWTRKVTDVRNWFEFSVNEIWRETEEVKEFYSDSSGKSGGQKEKLAYTILASALAYQFGLGWGENRSRTFRFVMIDEAFGRGSDESARYALELFKKLNLQLLIVTPLQKIHVIEDYVRAVHLIHNKDGKFSMVRDLTIEEYREELVRRKSPAPEGSATE